MFYYFGLEGHGKGRTSMLLNDFIYEEFNYLYNIVL